MFRLRKHRAPSVSIEALAIAKAISGAKESNELPVTGWNIRARMASWDKHQPQVEPIIGVLVGLAFLAVMIMALLSTDVARIDSEGPVTVYRSDPDAARPCWIVCAAATAIVIGIMIWIRRWKFCTAILFLFALSFWLLITQIHMLKTVVRIAPDWFSIEHGDSHVQTFYYKDIDALIDITKGPSRGSRSGCFCRLKSGEEIPLGLGIEGGRKWVEITVHARAHGVQIWNLRRSL